jgi:hypothetical protein
VQTGRSQLFTQNDPAIFGYPIQNLKDLPNGEYYVQHYFIAMKLFIAKTAT